MATLVNHEIKIINSKTTEIIIIKDTNEMKTFTESTAVFIVFSSVRQSSDRIGPAFFKVPKIPGDILTLND